MNHNRLLFAPDTAIETPSPAPPSGLGGWMSGLKGYDPLAKPDASPAPAGPSENPKPPASPAEPTAPPAAKPAETAATVKDDEEKWPRDAKGWEKFKANRKTERDELSAKIAAAEKKAQEAEAKLSTAGTVAEYEATKARLAERDAELERYSEQLRVAAVERHPKFVKHFSDRTNAQLELAKRIAPNHAERIKDALTLPDGNQRTQLLDGLLSELSPLNQARIGSVLNELSNIDRERGEEIAKAGETYKTLQLQTKAQQDEAVKAANANWTKTFDEQLSLARKPDAGIFLLQPKDGDVEWNAGVDKRVAEARKLIFDKHPPAVMAQAAMRAAVFPDLVGYTSKLANEVTALEAQIKALKGANPGVRPATEAPANPGAPAAPRPGSSPREALGGWMKPMVDGLRV